jgi:hypothetical protein
MSLNSKKEYDCESECICNQNLKNNTNINLNVARLCISTINANVNLQSERESDTRAQSWLLLFFSVCVDEFDDQLCDLCGSLLHGFCRFCILHALERFMICCTTRSNRLSSQPRAQLSVGPSRMRSKWAS